MRASNVGLHTTGDNHNNVYPKRSEFHSQGLGVGVQSGFRGIVDAAKDIRHFRRDGADIDNRWRGRSRGLGGGGDEEGRKSLSKGNDGEEVGIKGEARFYEGDVEGGNGIVAAAGN